MPLAGAPPWIRRAIVTSVFIAAYLLFAWWLDAGSGLTRTVINRSGGMPLETRVVDAIDLLGVEKIAVRGVSVAVTWQGGWEVPASGLYDLVLVSHGNSSWDLDGHRAIEAVQSGAVARRTVWLAAGFHSLDVRYEPSPGDLSIDVRAAGVGQPPLRLSVVRPQMPRQPLRRSMGRVAVSMLGWAALVALALTIRAALASWPGRPRLPATLPRTLVWTALAVILAHGATLRVDAITGRFGPVSSPSWLAAFQTRTWLRPESIRPSWIQWEREPLYPHKDAPSTHYFSDPYIYLDAARHMTSFYIAHFREPVFPFATRMALHVLADQDVAVSVASASFSVLAIWLTYMLGAAVWSRPVGLLAALGFSLDSDVIAHASLGWRDDAYVAVMAAACYLLIRCWRAGQSTGVVRQLGRVTVDALFLEAAALGVAAGFAILTRFMAGAFVATAFTCLPFTIRGPWRLRLTAVGIASLVAIVIAAPYFINCWRVFGDPLYTFNVHGNIYSAAEGAPSSGSTAAYVRQKIAAQPLETIDTVAQGLSTYPFENKWTGLDPWLPGLSMWGPVSAVIGMILLAATPPGRLLIITLVVSLLPFSLTWPVDPNFRFTEYVYPALLVAAAVPMDVVLRGVRALLVASPLDGRRVSAKPAWWAWAAVVGAGTLGLWFVTRTSPSLMFRETLQARGVAMVTAGARDAAFFDRGWSEVIHAGDVVSQRVTLGDSSLMLPLPSSSDYTASVRMDPFPRPLVAVPARLPVVDVTLNGAPVATLTLAWSSDRIGSYEIALPKALVRAGTNRIDFRLRRPAEAEPVGRPGLSDGDAVSLWYVRVSR